MNNDDDPLGYFITWTIYGTHLQGDSRGWRRRKAGNQTPQPLLSGWHAARLSHPIELLTEPMRETVEIDCQRHCNYRDWKLWRVSARTNHVHVVVTAHGYSGDKVRDQLKANCTRGLREQCEIFRGRPVWTVGGDWQCINSEEELEVVVRYVGEAQDQKGQEGP